MTGDSGLPAAATLVSRASLGADHSYGSSGSATNCSNAASCTEDNFVTQGKAVTKMPAEYRKESASTSGAKQVPDDENPTFDDIFTSAARSMSLEDFRRWVADGMFRKI